MNSLAQLWCCLAEELGTLCGIDPVRDIETMSRRVEHEGDAFLRITLPALGKCFDQALDRGRYSSDLAPGFQVRGGLPLFLGGFLRKVFDSRGRIFDDPCIESIRAIRQLCALAGKIEAECTEVRNRAAVQGYVEADDACSVWDQDPQNADLLNELRSTSRFAVGWLLSDANRQIALDDIVPKHGPGATADRLLGNQKYSMQYWPAHLQARFPWWDWAMVSPRFNEEYGLEVSDPVIDARLCLVPKTMSSPRVIVMEPTAVQYMQQALLQVLTDRIEQKTSMIGFTRQSPNRSMAREGSLTRDLVTLDLSEASDRVTLRQAEVVFSGVPDVWEALLATRSDSCKLPDGRTRPVYKFASMGSAVCFPVEAVTFWTAVLMAIQRYHRRKDGFFRLTYSFLRKLEGRVRVYGDDIIAPYAYLMDIREVFHQLGWRINPAKSFSEGFFRESCGGDFYAGEDVTPIRVRRPLSTSIRDPHGVQSTVSLRNQLYLAGYWRTAERLDQRLLRVTKGLYPVITELESGVVGRVSVCFSGKTQKTDSQHRSLQRVFVLTSPIPANAAMEHAALLKSLLSPSEDSSHLERSGRPSVSYIKRKWMPITSCGGSWYGSWVSPYHS
jgi:hypothetical protein